MSHARVCVPISAPAILLNALQVIMPDDSTTGATNAAELSTLGVHGAPNSFSLPANSASLSHMDTPAASTANDVSNQNNLEKCRMYVEFNRCDTT
jgi:hypothetical protein